ncbi:MAG TPA: M1 family metallopeptidase [Acidimicrobiales bacterium]
MSSQDLPEPEFRLPDATLPRRYAIRLTPDLTAATFTGEEHVEIEILSATEEIVLNAVELSIDSASISEGWPVDASTIDSDAALDLEASLDEATEFLRLAAPSVLAPGRYTLHLGFAGVLNDRLCGFYKSTYRDDDDHEQVIATTQFEETDARRAFPCFDEPAMKAIFSITLDVPPGLFAVSNSSEIASEPLAEGGRRVTFADTIVMSTYIVAFVVGPLTATAPVLADGVAIRVVHIPGKEHLTAPAIECAVHALSFYSNYFGIPYPSDKLDLVALPDFAAGAMENLGCVTFREAVLLADPAMTSRPELQRIAEVVEHEIAHMWFGDLVTMRWWNGIWLNEAFATFMSLLCQDSFRPEWNCFIGFSRDKGGALAVDGLHATRPIEVPVNRPEEAAAMFDVLTYEKGAGVLWMLERYVGAETFRNGVRRYLAAHLNANTETTDLWDAIEAEAPADQIRAVMDSWIFQGGYPVIDAAPTDDEHLSLTQAPFAYLQSDPPPEDSAIGDSWLIPALYRSPGQPEQRVLIGAEPSVINRGGTAVVVNSGAAGFYRVNYDSELLAPLINDLALLEPGERYNLIADLWALALAGRGALANFFAVINHLADEDEPDVWSVVIGALGLCDRVIKAENRTLLTSFVRQVLQPQLARVGWIAKSGEAEQVPLLRSALVSALGTIGEDDAVIAHARELFAQDHERGESIDADLATAVLTVVSSHATRAEFDQILARMRHPLSPIDENRHLNCLTAVSDVGLAAEVLELCSGEIRTQNAPYLMGSMLRSRAIGVLTWSFIGEHFAEFAERFPANSIHRMLDGVSGLVAVDPGDGVPAPDVIRAFCIANIEPARLRLVGQSLERLDVNTAFGARAQQALAALLRA